MAKSPNFYEKPASQKAMSRDGSLYETPVRALDVHPPKEGRDSVAMARNAPDIKEPVTVKHAYDGGFFGGGYGPESDLVDPHDDGLSALLYIPGVLGGISILAGLSVWTLSAVALGAGVTAGVFTVGLALIAMGAVGVKLTKWALS